MDSNEKLPEILGIRRSYVGILHDMQVSVSHGEDDLWHVTLEIGGAFDDDDDYSGYFETERDALLAVKEFADTGRVPSSLKEGGFGRRWEEYREAAENEVVRDGLVPEEPMELEEWLAWTGKDPQFVGSQVRGIPGSYDLWEASNRVLEKRQQEASPTP